jgi:mono/diheme cytochrome c family protein
LNTSADGKAAGVRPSARVAALLVAPVFAVAAVACSSEDDKPKTAAERMASGKKTYDSICAACHGKNLAGTPAGPSMLDPVFAPATHPDEAFYRAVENGVTAHGHFAKTTWGPMAALPTVSRDQVTNVIAYVRAQQRRAGVPGA